MRRYAILAALFLTLASAQTFDPSLYAGLRWRMIGPFRGGRTVGIAGIAEQPGTFYIGVNNGGVWNTDDFGRTWDPVFDDQPTGSIGAVAVAPSQPDIVYVGSGEGLQRPDLSVGDGMYKSTDAGKTWRHLGLRDGQQIPQIIVDPRNPNILLENPNLLIEQPDAQRTQQELSNLLQRYPPTLRSVLALDPSLLTNQSYLAPYPALAKFLNQHPEIVRNPTFYIGEPEPRPDRSTERARVWENMVIDVAVLAGFSLAICLIAWLIRNLIDYRRWNRLTNVQIDVHSRLMDRFTNNEDLLAYINSGAGSKFLESAPIRLDAGPSNLAAPLGRILWTVQAGIVLGTLGIGLEVVSRRIAYEAAQPLHVLGVLGMALGLGLVISAIISYVISRRLGLVDRPNTPAGRANMQANIQG